MFLHRLIDPEARRAFAGLAYHVLHLDEVSAREARVVIIMLGELSLTVDDLVPKESFEVLAARIVHPRARLAAFIELVRLARVDRDLSSEELEVIQWLAGVWGISGAQVIAVLGWVERLVSLQREAEGMINNVG